MIEMPRVVPAGIGKGSNIPKMAKRNGLCMAVMLSLLILLASACSGTLEIGVETAEPTPTPMDDMISPAGTTVVDQDEPTPQTAVNPIYPAHSSSGSPDISADGRYVVFASTADNLVPGDTNQATDIFVYDRETDTTRLVSLAEDGSASNGASDGPSISADGRWIAYMSMASNIAVQDGNGLPDIFLHDRETGQTILVSATPEGSGGGPSTEAVISEDGNWVVFTSYASDILSDQEVSDVHITSVYAYDRVNSQIEVVSLSSSGEQANNTCSLPDVSSNGRWVVFWSAADNLVGGAANGIYLRDRTTGSTDWIADGFAPTISPDGRRIGFVTNSRDLVPDDRLYIAVHDQETGETSLAAVYAAGVQGGPYDVIDFSADGEWLAVAAPFPVVGGVIPDGDGVWQHQIFGLEQSSGTWRLLTTGVDGYPGNQSSTAPSISEDGDLVTFVSFADNLVTSDTNGAADVFVFDRQDSEVEMISRAVEP